MNVIPDNLWIIEQPTTCDITNGVITWNRITADSFIKLDKPPSYSPGQTWVLSYEVIENSGIGVFNGLFCSSASSVRSSAAVTTALGNQEYEDVGIDSSALLRWTPPNTFDGQTLQIQNVRLYDKNNPGAYPLKQRRRKTVKIFDATKYGNPPTGLDSSLVMVYESELFSTADRSQVDYQKVAEVAQQNQNADIVCLDIEVWKTNDGNIIQLNDSLSKFREVARTFKENAPKPALGLYAIPPRTDARMAPSLEFSTDYSRWRELCERMEMLGDYIDVIFPTFYARYEDQVTQQKMIQQYMYAAHRYGIKRVIPFYAPYFVGVVDNPEITDQMLSGAYTQMIMDVIAKHTDEMALWDYAANTTFIPGEWWPVLEGYL